jgi:transposase
MPEPYGVELRARVVAAYEAGEGSYASVAERFAIGEATVKRWVWRQAGTGDLRPAPKRGGNRSAISLADIERLVEALRDPTAGELTTAFNRARRTPARVHVSSMKRALHRHGYVVKKSADGRWRVCGRTSSTSDTPT